MAIVPQWQQQTEHVLFIHREGIDQNTQWNRKTNKNARMCLRMYSIYTIYCLKKTTNNTEEEKKNRSTYTWWKWWQWRRPYRFTNIFMLYTTYCMLSIDQSGICIWLKILLEPRGLALSVPFYTQLYHIVNYILK